MKKMDVNSLVDRKARFHPKISFKGMVSTQECLATKAGVGVLEEGGNAVDAAVTVGFTLAVTLPSAGNLGGGGFMMIKLSSGDCLALDYRERAPLAATEDLFLDPSGDVDPEKPSRSFLSIGVPGTVAGLTFALNEFGSIPLKRAIEPAVKYAEKGFPAYPSLVSSLHQAKELMKRSKSSLKTFFKADGSGIMPGETLVQRDLAESLMLIAEEGGDAFYRGVIGERIVDYIQQGGGIMTMDDLKRYKPTVRTPIHGSYRGYELFTMPPPSSGGVHLVQILNILEGYNVEKLGHNNHETIHLMAEAMKQAYFDRFKYLGDSDYVDVPVKGLTSKKYAEKLRENIFEDKASPSPEDSSLNPYDFEGDQTTHYSIIDCEGNTVSNTYTIAHGYGSKLMAPETGILLNNEMGDFTAKIGYVDGSGMQGGPNNVIAPWKKPLSSMTPTIVMNEDKPFLATGSVGGSLIITGTLQVIMNVIDHQMNIAESVSVPRIHQQWNPDVIRLEEGFSRDTVKLLRSMGHKVDYGNTMGSAQSVMYRDGVFYGASDPRTSSGCSKGV